METLGPQPQQTPQEEKKPLVTAQLRGETMAYAVQGGVYNLAANFFEPYINYRLQRHFSGPDAAHPNAAAHGSYGQNLAGEFAGDIIGSSTLILAETLASNELHAFSRAARSMVDPLYDMAARNVFAKECGQPDYEQKVEKWKTFQERNLVRSGIMAAAGIAGNVATQKLLVGNPSPTSLIFQGKLCSTAITTALGLTVRLAFPQQMKGMDRKMGQVFAPLLEEKGEEAGRSV